jgi:uncharacterized membrane protein
MTVPEQTEERDSTAPEAPVDRTAWGARFGWIIGAIVGLGLGFLGTYLIETVLLRSKPNALELASRIASPVFSGCFLLGALGGHYLGARRGNRWYKPLGVAAGILLLTLVWVLLSIAR